MRSILLDLVVEDVKRLRQQNAAAIIGFDWIKENRQALLCATGDTAKSCGRPCEPARDRD